MVIDELTQVINHSLRCFLLTQRHTRKAVKLLAILLTAITSTPSDLRRSYGQPAWTTPAQSAGLSGLLRGLSARLEPRPSGEFELFKPSRSVKTPFALHI